MSDLLNLILSLGALLISGLICSFLVIFNNYKNKIWYEFYKFINKKKNWEEFL